jgi:hypothetical protein
LEPDSAVKTNCQYFGEVTRTWSIDYHHRAWRGVIVINAINVLKDGEIPKQKIIRWVLFSVWAGDAGNA